MFLKKKTSPQPEAPKPQVRTTAPDPVVSKIVTRPVSTPGQAVNPDVMTDKPPHDVIPTDVIVPKAASPEKPAADDIPVMDQIKSATLLTRDGGEVRTENDDRRLIALFDNGIALVTGNKRYSASVRAVVNEARRAGYDVDTYHDVDVNTIINVYKSHSTARIGAVESEIDIERQRQLARIIRLAGAEGASDIHMRILPDYTEIKTRVFGRMKPFETMSTEDGKALIKACFAVASDVGNSASDVSFQQGALTAKSKLLPGNVEMLRLQYSPTSDARGGLVMRLKYVSRADEIEIDTLGYSRKHIVDISTMRKRTNGLYILAGKVSSGKSTTLQRVLNKMYIDKDQEISMYTIEEPVELELPGAIQVAAKMGPSGEDGFEMAMKAALRSDPNIIVLGEIRSKDLAALAIQAVMTGHAMWSTIHAGSALGILDRLLDLGVESWKLQDPTVVRGLVYQRLSGVMCTHCRLHMDDGVKKGRIEPELAEKLSKLFEKDLHDLYVRGDGIGCDNPKCKLGLSGRTVVAETVQTDPKLLELHVSGDRVAMRKYWLAPEAEGGMGGLPVLHHALSKVGAGLCDINEVEEEVDLFATYERDFMHLKPQLLLDVEKLEKGTM